MSTRLNGVVKFFKDEKGFGFIVPSDGSKDVFVHRNDLEGVHELINGRKTLKADQRVSFELVDSDKSSKGNGKKAGQVRLEV